MAKYHEILKDELSAWNQNALSSDLWQGISEERKRKETKMKEEAFDQRLFQRKTTGGMILVNLKKDPKANPDYSHAKAPAGQTSPMTHLAAEWKNNNDDAWERNLLREIPKKVPEYEPKASLLREADFTKRLMNREIEALCDLFSALMRYLDQEAGVICAIDEIDQYKTDHLSKEMYYTIKQLAMQISKYFDDRRYFEDNIVDG
ncbi:hypothetical protein Landi51_01283 [Colletotrichum acutatum]